MSSTDNSTIASYLAEHPRMSGALFTVLLLLTQAGAAAAAEGACTGGP